MRTLSGVGGLKGLRPFLAEARPQGEEKVYPGTLSVWKGALQGHRSRELVLPSQVQAGLRLRG